MPLSQRRWPYLAALFAVIFSVVWINAYHLTRDPMPPPSSHRSWQLVPRMIRLFDGYDARRIALQNPPQFSSASTFYPLPTRRPVDWLDPDAVYREFSVGGRFNQLVGRCPEEYATCMAHAYAIPAAVAVLFPGHPTLVGLVPTFYFCLLLAALYGIASDAAGRPAGVAAAAIAAGFPGLFGMSRWTEGYIVTASLSTCMVWCLVRSRGMSQWWPLVLYGCLTFTVIRTGEGFSEAAGAGLAVGGPFVVEVLFGLKEAIRERRWPWREVIGIAIVLGMLYFTTDWNWVRGSEQQMRRGVDEVDMGASFRDAHASAAQQHAISVWLYAYFLVNDYVRPPLLAFLALAVPFLFRHGPRHRVTMLAWFGVAFAGFSYMERKAIWYPIPMLPPLAALTAVGLASIPWPRVRVGALILSSVLGLHQLASLTISGVPFALPQSWVRPFPPEAIHVRWVDLAQTQSPESTALKHDAARFLAWINAHVPQRDRLLYVAAYTGWGEDSTPAMRLDWYLTLRRADIVVIEMAKKRYFQGRPYEGLAVSDFFALLCIAPNGHFVDCAKIIGTPPTDPTARDGAPGALFHWFQALNARSLGAIPDLPPVTLLQHAETEGLGAGSI